jgi:hypothetical protein
MKISNPGPAKGVTGQLIYLATGKYVFRVYDDHSHGFTDYDIFHSDMTITIDDDDAYFYTDSELNKYLDHAPETLGRNHDLK